MALRSTGSRGALTRALARQWRCFCSETKEGAKSKAPTPLTSKKDLEGAKQAEEHAKLATAFMFPWEKRAMDGTTGLTNTEKAYWIVFSGAMVYFGVKLAMNKVKSEEVDEERRAEEERRERLKKERALMVLRGESIIGGDEDPFEGLDPKEIDEYVRSNTKHDLAPAEYHMLPKLEEDDEFDGMSPEEINEAMAKRNQVAGGS